MPIYPVQTVGDLMVLLAQRAKDWIWNGTATAGAAASITDPSIPATNNDDRLIIGVKITTLGGTGPNQERLAIAPYTASTGLTTVDRNWTTTPDSTTTYLFTRRFYGIQLRRALQAAQREQALAHLSLLPVYGREIVLGSALPNNFDLFTTANVPDGLTLDSTSTFTSGTTVTHGARRALRMVTDGTNTGFVRFAIPRWGRYQGKTLRLHVLLRASIATRVTVEISDGTGTATSTAMAANNTWELIEPTRDLAATATQAQVSIEVSAGAAVTVDMDFWWNEEADSGYMEHDIDADRNIFLISDLRLSKSRASATGDGSYIFPKENELRDEDWDWFEDTGNTPRRLRIHSRLSSYRGRVLEYKGWQVHPEFTGATISYAGDIELILARAYYHLLLQDPLATAADRAQAEDDAIKTERKRGMRWPWGAKKIMAQ